MTYHNNIDSTMMIEKAIKKINSVAKKFCYHQIDFVPNSTKFENNNNHNLPPLIQLIEMFHSKSKTHEIIFGTEFFQRQYVLTFYRKKDCKIHFYQNADPIENLKAGDTFTVFRESIKLGDPKLEHIWSDLPLLINEFIYKPNVKSARTNTCEL